MKVIWMGLTLVETKLHILSIKWKILMWQTSPINVKKKKNKYHIWNMTNNMPIIGKWKTNTRKVDCCNRLETMKMCQNKQRFAQKIPMLCITF